MRTLALSAVFAFLALSCVGVVTVPRPPFGPPASTCEGVSSDLDIVTYNAGLGPGIMLYSSERAPFVADALASTPFDVLCLQEIWTDADRDAIVAKLGLPRENVTFAVTAGLGETGRDRCSAGELDRLAACTEEKCRGVHEEDVTSCALSQCRSALTRLFMTNRECLNCLAAMAGHSSTDTRRVCTTTGASRIYGGRNGVIMASRWPLRNVEAVLLPTSNANRAAVFARVDVPGRGEVELACTHLSSTQEIPPYHSGADDWDEEKATQLEIISRRLEARAGGRPQLLIGDMNFGASDGRGIAEESAWVWYHAHELGFSDPVAYADPPFCSICAGNTFIGQGQGARSTIIDHALLRDPPGGATLVPICASRLFQRPVTVTGDDGAPVVTNLSDHYGVRVKFRFR